MDSTLRSGKFSIAVLLVSAILALVLAAALMPASITNPDGIGYYSHVRSMVFDRDFLYWNEFEEMKIFPIFLYRTPTFHAGNHWAVGTGFFWLPFVLLAELFAWCTGFLNIPGIQTGGLSPLHMTAVNTASFFCAVMGLALIPGILRKLDLTPRKILFPVLFLGTPLLFYSIRAGSMSHAISFFTNTLFLRIWLEYRDRPAPYTAWLAGLTGGLLILVRSQEILLLVFPTVYLISRLIRRKPVSGMYPIWFLTGLIIGVAPQLLVNRALMGSFHGNMQITEMAWSKPAITGVLFSSFHGLFIWSPVLLLGIIGLIGLFRQQPVFAGICLVIFAFQTYLNAAFPAWWGSGSFGGRRFLGTLVLIAPGIAWLLAHKNHIIRRTGYVLTCLATTWSILLFITHSTVDQLISFENYHDLLMRILGFQGTERLFRSLTNPTGGTAFFLIKFSFLLLCFTILCLTIWFFHSRNGRITRITTVTLTTLLLLLTGYTCLNSLHTDPALLPDRAMAAHDIENGRKMMRLPVLKGQADMARYRGDTTRAQKLLMEILNDMPENYSVATELLNLYIETGERKQALSLYNSLADPTRSLPLKHRIALAQMFKRIQEIPVQ